LRPISTSSCRHPLCGSSFRVFPEVPRRSAFDPEVLAWRVLEALPRIDVLEGAALAANWKAADAAGRYELAWRVADVFDQYLIYRPDWLRFWESGKRLNLGPDEGWQAALWQELTASGEPHRARCWATWSKSCGKGKCLACRRGWPCLA
jgi:exodeoxyribonuclease V gamma subunit